MNSGGRRRRDQTILRLVLAVLALVAAACAAPSQTQTTPSRPAGPSPAIQGPAERMLARVNHHRARLGLQALTPEARLAAAAQSHSEDMAARDFFDHQGSDGAQANQRVLRQGYRYRVAAENIAGGLASPEATVDRWMESPGHRDNILLPDIRHAGVGYVFLSDDPGAARYRHYWTLTLGALGGSR